MRCVKELVDYSSAMWTVSERDFATGIIMRRDLTINIISQIFYTLIMFEVWLYYIDYVLKEWQLMIVFCSLDLKFNSL